MLLFSSQRVFPETERVEDLLQQTGDAHCDLETQAE
jgi:hypothetical protein